MQYEKPLAVADLVELLIEASNNEVDEFEELMDSFTASEANVAKLQAEAATSASTIARLEEEVITVTRELETLYGQVSKVQANAREHMHMLTTANRSIKQLNDKVVNLNAIIEPYKILGTPKQLRKKIKDYQERIANSKVSVDAAKKQNGTLRTEVNWYKNRIVELETINIQNSMQTLWSENGQHLLLFPTPLTMLINGKTEKQLNVLFMDNSGGGKLIGIDEDNEPLVCSMPRGGLKPKAATLHKAGEILRLFKKNKWRVTHLDLKRIQNGDDYVPPVVPAEAKLPTIGLPPCLPKK